MIEPVAANSIISADQTLETVTHRITIRRREDIRSGMRFAKGPRVFDIVTIHDPDELGRYLVCRVSEGLVESCNQTDTGRAGQSPKSGRRTIWRKASNDDTFRQRPLLGSTAPRGGL